MNPNNPDPSAEVTWGQQTSDEMFSTRFKYRLVDEDSGHNEEVTSSSD
jgi:hypothetical protein